MSRCAMASALMAQTFSLAPRSASRILLPTAESWCCRANYSARCHVRRGFHGLTVIEADRT